MPLTVYAWPKARNKKENPYNYLLYKYMGEETRVVEFDNRRFSTRGADILHIHWPDLILRDRRRWRLRWRFTKLLRSIRRFRRKGGKLIWTVHNLEPHETHFPDLSENYMLQFINQLDGLIFLSNASREALIKRYPQTETFPASIIPHMHYQDIYTLAERGTSRSEEGFLPEQTVIGVFGKIRAHKGIDRLLRAWGELHPEAARLFIAGNPGRYGLPQDTQKQLEEIPDALTLLRHIPDDEVGAVFAACDALILPYEKTLNSGSALLALSLRTPIIAPDTGSLPELAEQVGSNWAWLYTPPLTAKKLEGALNWIKNRTPDQQPDLTALAPEAVSHQTEQFYSRIANN